MGLDIYVYKGRIGKRVDQNNATSIGEYLDEAVKRAFTRMSNKLLQQISEATEVSTRIVLINKLQTYVKKKMKYSMYYKKITPELTNVELKEHIEKLQRCVYKTYDVYFRKVNFVYHYFHPFLEDEECVVTKPMVKDLINRCDRVIEAAKKVNILDDKYKFIIPMTEYYYKYQENENWLTMTDERKAEEEARIEKLKSSLSTKWVRTAKAYLPTQSGFFFGSTDYDIYYLHNVIDCKQQFQKLLKNWKENEAAYIAMSW